jgi:zinc transporter ZupT
VLLAIGLGLVLLVIVATLAGGALPLWFERHSRVFLAFSAGTLISLALIELIPAGLGELSGDTHAKLLFVVGAFLVTMLLDKLHVLHPHRHGMDTSCPEVEHDHPPLAIHGAWGLVVHSVFDGVALAAAWRGSLAAALAVALALAAHKFADGITTVTLVLTHHHRKRQAIRLLAANAAALVLGIAAGLVVPLGERQLGGLLLIIAGFFLYLGACDLLPSVSRPVCRKRDVAATALGMALIAVISMALH